MNPRNAFRWIPSLYLMEGIPFGLVSGLAPLFYKFLTNSNNATLTFYTSLFTIPWFLKPLIAPFLENFSSKQKIILITQCLLAITVLLISTANFSSYFLLVSGALFFLLAFISSLHDIVADGFYMVMLEQKAQAYFVGIRTVFYQLGKIAAQGGSVFLAGFLLKEFHQPQNWQISLGIMAACLFFLTIYNYIKLPCEKNEKSVQTTIAQNLQNVFLEFWKNPQRNSIIFFILIYNFPESQLTKILPLFLADKISNGGLGLNIQEIGMIFGIIGTTSMLIGISLAGIFLARFSLKTCFFPLTLFTLLASISFLLLSLHPSLALWKVCLAIIIGTFATGIGNGVYMYYLLEVFGKTRYSMSHYAIGTSLMGISFTLASASSGFFQSLCGYSGFFIWTLLSGIFITFVTHYFTKKIFRN